MAQREGRTREPGVETTLLARCRQGDEIAFAELYDATSSRLFGLVLRVVRDHAQAEEVTQEVYLTIWQDAARFDPARGSAWGWLCTIAHRKAVDRVRSAEASRQRDRRDHEMTEPLRVDGGVDPVVAAVEGNEARAALVRLSPVQREAVELAYFGGYTHAEISALLSIPLGTAKTRIRDGLRNLRDLLAPAAASPA